MSADTERRFVQSGSAELRATRAADGQKRISGYAIVYGRDSVDLGGFTEEIAGGAAGKALKRSDPVLLLNHDPNHLLGRVSAGTVTLAEDRRGVRFDSEIDPNDPTALRVHRLIERGDLTGASFAFTVAKNGDRWVEKGSKQHRIIDEIGELYDLSVVTYPAYKSTQVSARALELARRAAARPPAPGASVPMDILRRRLLLAELD